MATKKLITVTFDTFTYERSHGTKPKGRGSWAFGLETDEGAFDILHHSSIQILGDEYVIWAQGTLTEAKKAVRAKLVDIAECQGRSFKGGQVFASVLS